MHAFELVALPSKSLLCMHGPTDIPTPRLVLMQPEGEGKYVWVDQSTYEGGWKVPI